MVVKQKYVIITPAKDEEEYIAHTLESVVNQTMKPVEWIIVDDGSIDRTSTIVDKYVKQHGWIRRISNNTYDVKRSGGSKVVRAFKAGFREIKRSDYDFIVKLDADLTLPNNYFQAIADSFSRNKRVGLCGGICMTVTNGKLRREKSARYHLRGPIKSYTKECFAEIGGLREVFNWDSVDEMLALYHGWEVKILDLEVVHHRPTSTLINNEPETFYKAGFEYYKEGYDPVLACAKAAMLLASEKTTHKALLFLKGFMRALATNEPRYFDKRYNRFVRGFQYKRILKGGL